MLGDDVSKLHELIHADAIVKPSPGKYGKAKCELREPQEPDSVICVDGLPEASIVFNLDGHFSEPSKIFAGTKQECCRADYVIVAEDKHDKYMVFIEMKSGANAELSHMKNQLRGASAFMGYCQAILKEFWRYDFPVANYQKRFVVCTRTSQRYSRKPGRDLPVNADVDNPLRLEGRNLFPFNLLIGRKS